MHGLKQIPGWILPAYMLALGMVHASAYWSSFQINVFEYSGFSNYAATAVYSLMYTVVFWVVGSFISFLVERSEEQSEPHVKVIPISTAEIILKDPIIFSCMILIAVPCVMWGNYWALLFVAAMVFVGFVISSQVLRNVASGIVRRIIFLAFFILVTAFVNGKNQAKSIIEGSEYSYIVMQEEVLRYIGRAGNRTFFLKQDGATVLILPDDGRLLELKRFEGRMEFSWAHGLVPVADGPVPSPSSITPNPPLPSHP